jgi:polyisoprenoid-binding protein YceI
MATWKIDTAHSEVKFKVRHLVISTVTGNFDVFSGVVKAAKMTLLMQKSPLKRM